MIAFYLAHAGAIESVCLALLLAYACLRFKMANDKLTAKIAALNARAQEVEAQIAAVESELWPRVPERIELVPMDNMGKR